MLQENGGVIMKKTVSLLILCFTFALAAVCQARPLPNSEFSLGGLNVTHCTLDYASSLYGEPEYITDDGRYFQYHYGESVLLKGWRGTDGTIHINYVSTRADNGWGTPAGLTVGMNKSVATDLYGYESARYDKRSGLYKTIYPHIGSGSGAGMFVYTDSQGIIQRIDVID